jgi:hypothetical protein
MLSLLNQMNPIVSRASKIAALTVFAGSIGVTNRQALNVYLANVP